MAGKTVGGLAHVCSPNVRVGRTCSSTRTSVVGTSTVGTRTSTVRTSTHLGTYLGRKMSREARPTTSATLECVRVLFAETAIAGRAVAMHMRGGAGGRAAKNQIKRQNKESTNQCILVGLILVGHLGCIATGVVVPVGAYTSCVSQTHRQR